MISSAACVPLKPGTATRALPGSKSIVDEEATGSSWSGWLPGDSNPGRRCCAPSISPISIAGSTGRRSRLLQPATLPWDKGRLHLDRSAAWTTSSKVSGYRLGTAEIERAPRSATRPWPRQPASACPRSQGTRSRLSLMVLREGRSSSDSLADCGIRGRASVQSGPSRRHRIPRQAAQDS